MTLLFWRPQSTESLSSVTPLSITLQRPQHRLGWQWDRSGLQAVGPALSWLPAHTTKATLQWQRVAQTLRATWPEQPDAAEKSGSAPLPTSVPARELGRREEGVMAEPHRVKLNKAFGAFHLKKSSATPPTMGRCGVGRVSFTEQLPKSICSWQQAQTVAPRTQILT